jgi:Tol biopolymer transport system component
LGISTINVGGGGKVQVTHVTHNNTDDEEPSYSPDGKRITYSRGGERNSAIYTINVGGGGESKVTEGGYPSWGPRP